MKDCKHSVPEVNQNTTKVLFLCRKTEPPDPVFPSHHYEKITNYLLFVFYPDDYCEYDDKTTYNGPRQPRQVGRFGHLHRVTGGVLLPVH